MVRVCCIRSFGHFLTKLQGNVLHFNPEAGIFTSISQSEQDNLLQQAKAQFRMVSDIWTRQWPEQPQGACIQSSLIPRWGSLDVFKKWRCCVTAGRNNCEKYLINDLEPKWFLLMCKATFPFDVDFIFFICPGWGGGSSKSLNEGYGPASTAGFYIITLSSDCLPCLCFPLKSEQ